MCLKARIIEVGGTAAVLIQRGSTVPGWLYEELDMAGVEIERRLDHDILYPCTRSIVNPNMWDVKGEFDYQEFRTGDNPAKFLRGQIEELATA